MVPQGPADGMSWIKQGWRRWIAWTKTGMIEFPRPAMIKTLVFHIGDPKNGSSSIQKAMQRRACHAEGVSYVCQKELNASPLALSMNPKRRTAEERQKLQERLFAEKRQWAQDAEADIGLISSEFFVLVPPDKMLRDLAQHWPEFAGQARLIAYVRPHVSRFCQDMRSGPRMVPFSNRWLSSRVFWTGAITCEGVPVLGVGRMCSGNVSSCVRSSETRCAAATWSRTFSVKSCRGALHSGQNAQHQ